MNVAESIQQYRAQIEELREQFASLPIPWIREELLPWAESAPLDPVLDEALKEAFQVSSQGRLELLRMQLDERRRMLHATVTEQVFRPYGVMRLLTPIVHEGKVLGYLSSGPLKLNGWQGRELETLAQVCGVSARQLPSGLERAVSFSSEQLHLLQRAQEERARGMAAMLSSGAASAPAAQETPSSEDWIPPGFADHLDLLFRYLEDETQQAAMGREISVERLLGLARRGRHLSRSLAEKSEEANQRISSLDLHRFLDQRSEQLREHVPGLRFELQLEARNPVFTQRGRGIEHLLGSLLDGVADGLAQDMVLVKIKSDEVDGMLRVRIRDAGGMATFSGLRPDMEAELLEEQDEAAQECGDWYALADSHGADLTLHQEDGVVMRAELRFPREPLEDVHVQDALQLAWVVEHDDREYRNLEHMLLDLNLRPMRFRNAKEMQDEYPIAPEPPSMVLMNYNLPDLRGAALRGWLYEQDPDLPVVLFASFKRTHPGVMSASGLPNTMYVQKPFDAQMLKDLMTLRAGLDTRPE